MNSALSVIGIMSGTSLDGVDLCFVKFKKENDKYLFEIQASESFPYSNEWQQKLKNAFNDDKVQLEKLNVEYGEFLGTLTKLFIEKYKLSNQVDLVCSHGHTIFHKPAEGITVQIGNGNALAQFCGIQVINDFRIKDVQLGGQGAPLVPIGDQLLFGEYESCLNLGGIANISFNQHGKRIAFDICPANLPLNKIVQDSFQIPFDKNGAKAASGKLIPDLLAELNSLDFYLKSPPKSLGLEWLIDSFYPILEKYAELPREDVLRTLVDHQTSQIIQVVNQANLTNCLITGGGALNQFFINQLKSKSHCDFQIPSTEIIEFKEALIFAFLGYLNLNHIVNTLSSVTGAKNDSIGGILHLPPL